MDALQKDAGLARCTLAQMIYWEADTMTIEEREASLGDMPDDLIVSIDVDNDAHLLFVRDFSDGKIALWRMMTGDMFKPFAGAEGTKH